VPNSGDDLRSEFVPYQFPGLPELPWAFRVAIPARCRPLEGSPPGIEPGAIFTPLLLFAAPAPGSLEVFVSLTLLPQEMGAGDLALIAAERSGLRVLSRRDPDGTGADQSELIARESRGGGPWLRWARVIKDGPRVFRIDAATPEEGFEDVAQTCGLTVRSFELLNPEGRPGAEDLVEVMRGSLVPFSFRYPASWRLTEFAAGEDLAGFVLDFVHREKVRGTVTVELQHAGDGVPPSQHARAFRARLTADGFRLNGAPIVAEPPPHGFSGAYIYAPPATWEGRETSVGLFIGETGHATALMSFACPARWENPWAWALTRRAFEIVRSSISLSI
jgi:hypothetical protein